MKKEPEKIMSGPIAEAWKKALMNEVEGREFYRMAAANARLDGVRQMFTFLMEEEERHREAILEQIGRMEGGERPRHPRKGIHFCYRMTGDQARAEEAAQEIFLRIARAASTYRPTAKFTTWMYTIARRTTLNFLRDEKEHGEKVAIHATGEEGDPAEGYPLPGRADWDPEQVAWGGQLQEGVAG